MKKLKTVLSIFNGYGGCILALQELGISVDKYYSSEVDKYAMIAANALYPNTIELGDVKKWREWDIDFSKVDLLTAGFPCQPFSISGRMQGIEDPRGDLVHDLVDLWNHAKKFNADIKFMFENTKMTKPHLDYLNKLFGVNAVFINSALVSAQDRRRNYWSEQEIIQPQDTCKLLIDILDDLPDCQVGLRVRNKSKCIRVGGRNSPFGSKQEWDIPFQRINRKCIVKKGIEKSATLTVGGNGCGNHSDMDIIHTPQVTRRYSVRECARLQGIPEHKIEILLNCDISNSQLYKMIANGWQLDTIKHIFEGLQLT